MRKILTLTLLLFFSVLANADVLDNHPQTEDDTDFEEVHLDVEGFKVILRLDPEEFTATDAKDAILGLGHMRKQLVAIKGLLPTHVYRKLGGAVEIYYTDGDTDHSNGTSRYYYSPSTNSIRYFGLTELREHLDGDLGTGVSGEGLMLHELAHAWHDIFIEDGFDNQDIIDAYNESMDYYDTCCQGDHIEEGHQGSGEDYYWTTNELEWFAEFSLTYWYRNRADEPRTNRDLKLNHYWLLRDSWMHHYSEGDQ